MGIILRSNLKYLGGMKCSTNVRNVSYVSHCKIVLYYVCFNPIMRFFSLIKDIFPNEKRKWFWRFCITVKVHTYVAWLFWNMIYISDSRQASWKSKNRHPRTTCIVNKNKYCKQDSVDGIFKYDRQARTESATIIY